MSKIKAGDEITYCGYDTDWQDVRVPVEKISTLNGRSFAHIRIGQKELRVYADGLNPAQADELSVYKAFYDLVYRETSEAQLLDFLRKQAVTGDEAAWKLRDAVLPAIRALKEKSD